MTLLFAFDAGQDWSSIEREMFLAVFVAACVLATAVVVSALLYCWMLDGLAVLVGRLIARFKTPFGPGELPDGPSTPTIPSSASSSTQDAAAGTTSLHHR